MHDESSLSTLSNNFAKMEIIPAILPKDFRELEQSIETIRGATRFVQIDICDGHFVPSSTWPYKKHDQNFEAILSEERGLPAWENIEYEIDLMISKPEDEVMRWVTAGAARIIIHIESTSHIDTILEQLSGIVNVGLAINIDTPSDRIEPYADRINFIQCMGIARIGYQGQPFDDRVLNKIKELRHKYPHMPISVDGGVNLQTISLLRAAGATRLVAGSAVFHAEIPVEALRELERA